MKGIQAFTLAVSLLATTGLVGAGSPSSEDLLREARQFERESRPREALEVYLQALEQDPDHLEAICAAAYLFGQVGKRDPELRKDYFHRSLELAQQANRLAPGDPDATFVLAWAYGGLALISSAREKVELAQKIKPLIDNTLQKKPKEDRAWYILANWRFRIADANLVERTAARLLAGGLPESATYKSAIEAYRKAVALRPDSILYRRELARALEKDGQLDKARRQCEAALHLPVRNEEDPTLLAQCRAALRRLAD